MLVLQALCDSRCGRDDLRTAVEHALAPKPEPPPPRPQEALFASLAAAAAVAPAALPPFMAMSAAMSAATPAGPSQAAPLAAPPLKAGGKPEVEKKEEERLQEGQVRKAAFGMDAAGCTYYFVDWVNVDCVRMYREQPPAVKHQVGYMGLGTWGAEVSLWVSEVP